MVLHKTFNSQYCWYKIMYMTIVNCCYCVSVHFSVAKTSSLSRSPTLASTAWFLSMHESLHTDYRNSLHLALYTLFNRLECAADTTSSGEVILHSLRASVNVLSRVVSSSMQVWVACILLKWDRCEHIYPRMNTQVQRLPQRSFLHSV